MVAANDLGQEGLRLTMGKESILFYESLLKLWILTGRQAFPPNPTRSTPFSPMTAKDRFQLCSDLNLSLHHSEHLQRMVI